MRRIAKLSGILLLISLCSPLSYGDDLVTILNLALENDPTLKQAQANYRANRESVIQSRAILLPSFGLSASTTRITSGLTDSVYGPDPITGEFRRFSDHSYGNSLNNHSWAVGLNQSIVNLANWYTYQGAKATDKASAVTLAAQEQDLIMRVATAYFDVLRSLDALNTNIQEEEAALRSLEQTRQREEVGLVAITDVYDSQAAFDLAKNTTILAQDFVQARYEGLEALTGQAHPNIELLRDDFPIVEVDGNLREWERQARSSNLQITAAEYNVEATRKNLQARKSAHLPTLEFSSFWGHIVTSPVRNAGVLIGGGASDRTQLALNLTFPIYSGGGDRSRRRAAEYRVQEAQESLELTRRQLTQNVRNAFRRVNTDVLVIAQRQQSIRSTQSALDATELGAEVGTRNIVEVLLARENLYQALRQYADSRYTYVIDTLLLKQITGILTPQDIIDLNEWLQIDPQ